MFISQKEWKEHHGGAKGSVSDETQRQQDLKRQRVAIDACGLSLAPCYAPVATRIGHPILYDLQNIIRYVKNHRKDPVSGRPLSGRDLVRVRFTRGEDGHYICPATRKPIGPLSKAYIVLTTGRVYLADALDALCFKTNSFLDPVDSTEFSPSTDLLTLNNPSDPAWRDIKRWSDELGAPSKAGEGTGAGAGSVRRAPSTKGSGPDAPVSSLAASAAASSSSSSSGTKLDASSVRILEEVRQRAAKRARTEASGEIESSGRQAGTEADDPFSTKGGLGSFAPAPKRLRIAAPVASMAAPDGYGGGGEGTGDPDAERARALELGDAYHVPQEYERPSRADARFSGPVSRGAGFTSTAMASAGEDAPRCRSVRDVVGARLQRLKGSGKKAFLRVTIGASGWTRPEPRTKEQLHKAAAAVEEVLGTLSLELDVSSAPLTCHNFLQLVRQGKYTGVAFHRLIRNFMVQGGDPTASGKGGMSWDGGKFLDECRYRGSNASYLKHTERGLLSMANAGSDSNGSQFFILFYPAPHLDGKHTVFGKVVGGYSTLRAVELLPTGDGNRPKRRVCMCKWEVFGDPFMDDAKERRRSLPTPTKKIATASDSKQPSPAPSSDASGSGVRGPVHDRVAASSSAASSSASSAPRSATQGLPATEASLLSSHRPRGLAAAAKRPSKTAGTGLLDGGMDVDW